MALTENNIFRVNRGSDLEFKLNWPNGIGGNLDLTDYTVDGYEVDPALVPVLTLTITDAATGLITGRVEWDENLPEYQEMGFRIRIRKGTLDTTTNLLKVAYQ